MEKRPSPLGKLPKDQISKRSREFTLIKSLPKPEQKHISGGHVKRGSLRPLKFSSPEYSLGAIIKSYPSYSLLGKKSGRKKKKIFVGSSSEFLKIAKAIQANLDDGFFVQIWAQGFFNLSSSYLENLVRELRDFSFAILVVTPDDLRISRGTTNFIPRDNVIFEIGLCMGMLGRERTFIVHPKGKRLALPSDLSGIMTATYDPPEDQNDPRQLMAALGRACLEIEGAIYSVVKNGTPRKTK